MTTSTGKDIKKLNIMSNMGKNKVKDAVFYICATFDPRGLGGVKLHKALWFADTNAFLSWGKPITGARYIKMKYGPFVDGLDTYVAELEAEGKIEHRFVDEGTHSRHEYRPLKKYSIECDSLEEKDRAMLDHIGIMFRGLTASAVSDLSHDSIWKSLALGAEMPVNSVVYKTLKIERPS